MCVLWGVKGSFILQANVAQFRSFYFYVPQIGLLQSSLDTDFSIRFGPLSYVVLNLTHMWSLATRPLWEWLYLNSCVFFPDIYGFHTPYFTAQAHHTVSEQSVESTEGCPIKADCLMLSDSDSLPTFWVLPWQHCCEVPAEMLECRPSHPKVLEKLFLHETLHIMASPLLTPLLAVPTPLPHSTTGNSHSFQDFTMLWLQQLNLIQVKVNSREFCAALQFCSIPTTLPQNGRF